MVPMMLRVTRSRWLGALEKARCLVVDIERREQVGVAVGQEGEAARAMVERTKAAIRAALNADLVP